MQDVYGALKFPGAQTQPPRLSMQVGMDPKRIGLMGFYAVTVITATGDFASLFSSGLSDGYGGVVKLVPKMYKTRNYCRK